MTYKLTLLNTRWIVAIERGGSYHTSNLDDALAFIRQYETRRKPHEIGETFPHSPLDENLKPLIGEDGPIVDLN